MKTVSDNYLSRETADIRKPIELFHVWFNDNDLIKTNKEWFFTNHDQKIYNGSRELNVMDPVNMQIIDLDENSWQIGASEGHPFKLFLVVSLYEKYIAPYDSEWNTNPEHIYGINYWFQHVAFADLEEAFYTNLVSTWSDVYPSIDNPYDGVPYNAANGILETSAFTASLNLNGFVNEGNNIEVTITALAPDGNTINVPKSLYTLIPEPEIPEIPYYDYDYNHTEEDLSNVEFPSCYLNTFYDKVYFPATIERGDISYDSELDVQTVSITFVYHNEVAIKFIAVNPVNLLWVSILKIHLDDINLISSSEYRTNFITQLYEKYVEPYDSEWETNPDHIGGQEFWYNSSISIENLEESFYNALITDWDTVYPEIENPYDGVEFDSDNAIAVNLESDVIFLGQIKDVSFQGLQAQASCVSFSHFLKENIPIWRYQLTCNHRLFDDYCSLTKGDYVTQGQIVSIDGAIITVTGISSLSPGYLVGGEIVKDSESRKIVSHAGNSIKVAYVFTKLMVNDFVNLYPGCDGRIETCRDTFDNILNYLGFPFIPLEHENPALRTNAATTVSGASGTVPSGDGGIGGGRDAWEDTGGGGNWETP